MGGIIDMNNNNNLRNEWKILIDEWRNSGMTKKGWCSANNQSIHKFRYWHDKFESEKKAPQWVEVPMNNMIQTQPLPITIDNRSGSSITVKINQVSIEVNTGFDPELLADVVRALS